MSPLEQANMSPFSEHASNEGACRLVALEENSVYLTFFSYIQSPIPKFPMIQLYPMNISSPSLLQRQI